MAGLPPKNSAVTASSLALGDVVSDAAARPVELTRLTSAFDARYAFDFFDRRKEGAISIKDLGTLLALHGVNPRSPRIEALVAAAGVTDRVAFAAFEAICAQALPKTPPAPAPTAEQLAAAVHDVTSYLAAAAADAGAGADGALVDWALVHGPDALSKAEHSQLRRLALTQGFERGGQVDVERLLLSEPSKPTL